LLFEVLSAILALLSAMFEVLSAILALLSAMFEVLSAIPALLSAFQRSSQAERDILATYFLFLPINRVICAIVNGNEDFFLIRYILQHPKICIF